MIAQPSRQTLFVPRGFNCSWLACLDHQLILAYVARRVVLADPDHAVERLRSLPKLRFQEGSESI